MDQTDLDLPDKIRIAKSAANAFYQSPNYDAYTQRPTDEHPQVLIEQGHRRAQVDEGLSDLILAIWSHDLETAGSCQRLPSGQAYVGFNVPGEGDLLAKFLEHHKINCELRPKISQLKSQAGEILRLDTASVRFSPTDIERITQLLQSTPTLEDPRQSSN